MKASRWMALPLLLGLSTLAVACDSPQETEVNEQLEDERLETDPTGVEPLESEEGEGADGAEETEGAEGDD